MLTYVDNTERLLYLTFCGDSIPEQSDTKEQDAKLKSRGTVILRRSARILVGDSLRP